MTSLLQILFPGFILTILFVSVNITQFIKLHYLLLSFNLQDNLYHHAGILISCIIHIIAQLLLFNYKKNYAKNYLRLLLNAAKIL